MNIQPLRPITTKQRHYEFIAMDTEGTGKRGDFILAATWDESGGRIYKDRQQLKQELFSRSTLNKRIVCANLEYDYAVAFQPFRGNFHITLAARRWLKASYSDNSKHAWTAFDIQRVAPLSVGEMGKILGLPKWDTPPVLVTRRNYQADEWYCSSHNRLWCVECYCLRDAEITYKFTNLMQDAILELGGEMQLTAASTALNLFRRKYLHEEIAGCMPDKNDLARNAYYGGRVEVYRLGTSKDVNAFDINSLYPFVMRRVEVGDPATYRRTDRPKNWMKYLESFGHITATIDLPTQHVGLLPYRQDERLYFPTGTVTGSWMLSEVRHAIEHGAHVHDVKSITYATRTLRLFEGYVDDLYSLRSSMKEVSDRREVAVKLYLNSLYGKFAQRTDGELQILISPPKVYDLSRYEGCEPVDIAGREMFLTEMENNTQPAHVQVAWAAEITAQARIKLYDFLSREPEKLIYCDTDSVHTLGTFPTSKKLGELKMEYPFGRATYFAPKEYGGVTLDGKLIHRAKGIPVSERATYLQNGTATFKQPIHTLSAIRHGGRIAEWVDITKRRKSDAMNRQHAPLDDYNKGSMVTHPFGSDELG